MRSPRPCWDHQHQLVQHGWVLLGDKGFPGACFEGHLAELGALLVRPDRADEPRRYGSMGRMRQWVERRL